MPLKPRMITENSIRHLEPELSCALQSRQPQSYLEKKRVPFQIHLFNATSLCLFLPGELEAFH